MSRSWVMAAVFSIGFVATNVAHAACGGGWPIVTGAEPDVYFPTGAVTEKTVSITYQSLSEGLGGAYCGVYARSSDPNISVEAVYNLGEFRAYPEYAAIGPHAIIGVSKTMTFRIRVSNLGWYTGAKVDLFARTDDVFGIYQKVGRINLIIEPTAHATTFTATATASNVAGAALVLDHPMLNNNPNRAVLVSPVWTGTYNVNIAGSEYNSTTNRWEIVNQNLAAMPVGTNYFVKIEAGPGLVHRHDAVSGNSSGHMTYIDHPVSNGNPRAMVIVTPTRVLSGPRNPNPIGVWYDSGVKKWSIYNQNFATMPQASFFIRVIGQQQPAPAPHAMVHVDVDDGLAWNTTRINNSNFTSSSRLVFTPNWSPNSVYNNHATGLWWDGGAWTVYNEDGATMPTGAAFNVWRPLNPL